MNLQPGIIREAKEDAEWRKERDRGILLFCLFIVFLAWALPRIQDHIQREATDHDMGPQGQHAEILSNPRGSQKPAPALLRAGGWEVLK